MNHLLKNLNPRQEEAVLSTEGPLLILAGAGSGKTRVITVRIAYMIENGVDPFNIIAITFTNKAAREMKERVMDMSERGDEVWVSTFHSACVRILRHHIDKINYENNFTIYDASDAEKIIKDILKQLNLDTKMYKPKSMMAAISSHKNELISPEECEKSADNFRALKVAEIYKLYQKRLKSSNALDFDDIIFKTVELFRNRPDVLLKYHNRLKYIMVDEYQDTNTAQYELIKLLSAGSGNICVVGDDDQSIYGWRGANIRNILDFEKDYRQTKTIRLEQNYRSTSMILDAANSVIENNSERKRKNLWTENGAGTPINLYRALSEYDEAEYIVNEIQKGTLLGSKYNDFSILYRTNAQSRALEDVFVKKSIPYRIFGGVRFYERLEIKDIMAYLKLLHNPSDDISIKRIINVPKRGIGNSTVDKISLYADECGMTFYEALLNLDDISQLGTRSKKLSVFLELINGFRDRVLDMSVTELISHVLEKTGYVKELELEGTDEAIGRIENISELVSKAAEFEEQSENKSLGAFLEEVALVADIDNFKEGEDAVSLMTLHSSKGLEFKTVFIAGAEDGLFPSYRSIVDTDKSSIEEERRLCYVGITRARESLYITCAASRMNAGERSYNPPSRFIKEIPYEFLNADSIPKQNKPSGSKTAIPGANKPFSLKPKTPAAKPVFTAPKNVTLNFSVGDKVRQIKYGIGVVSDIKPAGADFEVAISFPDAGVKKFMANLSKLEVVQDDRQ